MIVAGGDAVASELLEAVPDPDYVIAADSGLDLAMQLGIPVDVVVGDLDSASEQAADTARAAAVEFSIHPEDKDQTDLELALSLAGQHEPERVIIVGGGGGRLDHLLANAALIEHAPFRDIQWITADAYTYVVRERAQIGGVPGGLVTLLAIGSDATGVRTEGLAWELNGETLEAGSSRGVSNRFTEPVAHIEVATGALLVVVNQAAHEA
ncbi:MAG: thiamine diphosphokinase [Acidimicrobiia bacterium]